MKTEPIDAFKGLLRFFALPVANMPSYLAKIPENSGAAEYYSMLEKNPLKLAMENLLMFARCVRLSELGLPETSSLLEELKWIGDELLLGDPEDKQWTLKACDSKIPWLVFRRMARTMLEETGFGVAPPSKNVGDLLVESH
jgi:hypothetical protein